ncbi:hypothetical protein HDU84_001676 [Entophlyctis sp. JEL0112]|nr:hypothetical protein HDU84_001676 [Entophlyctis sp. JEL0112]
MKRKADGEQEQEGGGDTAKRLRKTLAEMSSSPVARIGFPAPQFTVDAVVNKQFKSISLSDYKGKWAKIIGCSIDSKFSHLCVCTVLSYLYIIDIITKALGLTKLAKMEDLTVADVTKKISSDYGVLKEDEGIAFRGTFIIDPKQKLRQITINDLDIGRSIDELKRLIDAFQFFEEHGQVCPMNWKKGAKTMVADPESA